MRSPKDCGSSPLEPRIADDLANARRGALPLAPWANEQGQHLENFHRFYRRRSCGEHFGERLCRFLLLATTARRLGRLVQSERTDRSPQDSAIRNACARDASGSIRRGHDKRSRSLHSRPVHRPFSCSGSADRSDLARGGSCSDCCHPLIVPQALFRRGLPHQGGLRVRSLFDLPLWAWALRHRYICTALSRPAPQIQ